MTYGTRLNQAMELASKRKILGVTPRHWRSELAQLVNESGKATITVQAIGDAVRDKYELKTEKHLAVSHVLGINADWLLTGEGEPEIAPTGKPPATGTTSPHRVASPPSPQYGTPSSRLTAGSKSGDIWQLPLITPDRLDLMQLTNSAPEVAALTITDVLGSHEHPDFAFDKAMSLPFDVSGTDVKAGYIAVFRPVPAGKKIRATELPLVVRSASGSYHVVSYNSLALAAGPMEVIAVCYHAYKPRAPGPLWD